MAGHVEAVVERLGIQVTAIRGARAWAKCPAHEDRSPSWMIRVAGERAGQHYCFACKFAGDLIDLVKKVRGVQYGAAKSWLSEFKHGEAEHEPVRSVRVQVGPLTRPVFVLPREVCLDPLARWVTPAREYTHRRGITDAQVVAHGIGYAIEGRLEGRIVLVSRDVRGRPVNYTARSYAGDSDDERRYLNAELKEHPDMSALFGEHLFAPMRRAVVLNEGAINALAVERVVDEAIELAAGGPVMATALGGSNVHPMHVAKLARFDMVIVTTDPDKAGDTAAEVLAGQLGRHTEVRRLRLDVGTDPASTSPATLRGALWHAIQR